MQKITYRFFVSERRKRNSAVVRRPDNNTIFLPYRSTTAPINKTVPISNRGEAAATTPYPINSVVIFK
jgi:hypothetical protein